MHTMAFLLLSCMGQFARADQEMVIVEKPPMADFAERVLEDTKHHSFHLSLKTAKTKDDGFGDGFPTYLCVYGIVRKHGLPYTGIVREGMTVKKFSNEDGVTGTEILDDPGDDIVFEMVQLDWVRQAMQLTDYTQLSMAHRSLKQWLTGRFYGNRIRAYATLESQGEDAIPVLYSILRDSQSEPEAVKSACELLEVLKTARRDEKVRAAIAAAESRGSK